MATGRPSEKVNAGDLQSASSLDQEANLAVYECNNHNFALCLAVL